jgi:hypothetical protein
MLRHVVLTVLVAAIWFTLNDSPGVTKAGLSSPKLAATTLVNTSQKTVLAQAQTARSVQIRETRKPRAPTRITVYDAGAIRLGPNAVRRCTDWYAEERRPSGTVIVPHMRCRWARR